jgi:uncharacterized protein (DUF2235 family)
MKLAVFADGTWNRMEPDGWGTNVVKLHQLSVNDRARGQVAFYDPGVGSNPWEKLRGGLFGVGISQNILDGYEFLWNEWKSAAEDAHELYLFGFSRGAYTVRSLAGLLGRIGLVRDRADLREAYELYRRSRDPQYKTAIQQFIQTRVLVKPRIRMIGVWDTVGALGIPLNALNRLNPFPHRFHDTSLGRRIGAAYHAVAIDERRVAYAPTLWDPLPPGSTQILEQVFFPGAHSDVGGGYKDDTRLGEITLEWMARRASAHGLLLDHERIPRCRAEHCYGLIHFPMKYLPVRRAPRAIANGAISAVVRHRWQAPSGSFQPFPYDAVNLRRDGDYAWLEWPEQTAEESVAASPPRHVA